MINKYNITAKCLNNCNIFWILVFYCFGQVCKFYFEYLLNFQLFSRLVMNYADYESLMPNTYYKLI